MVPVARRQSKYEPQWVTNIDKCELAENSPNDENAMTRSAEHAPRRALAGSASVHSAVWRGLLFLAGLSLLVLTASSVIAQPTVAGDEPTPVVPRHSPRASPAPAARELTAAQATVSEQPLAVVLVGEDPRLASQAALVTMLTGWSEAWSRQRADDYLRYYSTRFVPSGQLDLVAWQRQRRQRLRRPQSVEVAVAILDAELISEDRASLRFLQRYRSDRYRDVVTKRFELVREGEDWKILREIIEEE